MSWIAVGIGVGVGMAIGGPIGAGISAWIRSAKGNDRENQLMVVCPYCSKKVAIESEGQWPCPHCHKPFTYGDIETSQTIFFVTICSMLAKMAKTNGVVCKNEITAISNFFDEMELDSKEAIQINFSLFNYLKRRQICQVYLPMLTPMGFSNFQWFLQTAHLTTCRSHSRE